MDEIKKEYLISYYEKRVGLFGKTPAALGWSGTGYLRRYGAALHAGDFEGTSVLDHGCGMGDFYGFLRGKGVRVKYAGMDINRALIGIARERYPECVFRVADIEEEEPEGVFDYTVSCGVFNNRLEDITESAKRVIGILWRHTGKALVFNALSDKSADKDVSLEYYNAGEMLEFGRSISGRAQVREDLVPGDLFLFLYR